jgi:hypothetical protein
VAWDDDELHAEVEGEFAVFTCRVLDRVDEQLADRTASRRAYQAEWQRGYKATLPERIRTMPVPEAAREAIKQRIEARRVMRIKLPDTRESTTFKFRIISPRADDSNELEEVKGYVIASAYPETTEVTEGEGDAKVTRVVPHPRRGAIAEVFVRIGKPGHETALLDDWAQEFSRALQSADDPLPLLRRHRHKQYLPSGAVVGVKGITRCTSVVDLVCHLLQLKFCKLTDEEWAKRQQGGE